MTKFATWTKQFLNCAIHDSEPVRYCRNCGNLFSNVTVAYNTLDANETCKAIYFNQDRLNVLQTIYSSSLSLWEAGSCASNLFCLIKLYCFANLCGKIIVDCFDWVEPSDYSTQNISSRTQEFFDDLKNVTMCINTFRKNTCEDCAEDYNKVNALYNSIKESTKDVICFDIKDAVSQYDEIVTHHFLTFTVFQMNKTRLQWSRDLKCCKDRKSSLTAFIVTSIILSGLIPFTFYTGFMFFGWRREQQHDFLMDSGIIKFINLNSSLTTTTFV